MKALYKRINIKLLATIIFVATSIIYTVLNIFACVLGWFL